MLEKIKNYRPNFKTGHYIYIVATIIVGSIIMYPIKNAKYIDILFTSVASCTQSGLNTYDLNKFKLYQQIVIHIIATTTTPIVCHGSMLFFRLWKFEQRFKDIKVKSILDHKMRKTLTKNNINNAKDSKNDNDNNKVLNTDREVTDVVKSIRMLQEHEKEGNSKDIDEELEIENHGNPTIRFVNKTHPKEEMDNESLALEVQSIDSSNNLNRSNSKTLTNTVSNYLSYSATVGKNSNFINLTSEQKDELGGIEYRAVKLLAKILVGYYIGFHLLALIIYVAWINNQPAQMDLIREIGVNPTWWGIFIGQSAFNNLGYSLTPNSLANFSQSAYPQIWGVFFIICGHTGFPVVLRLIIWIMFILTKSGSLINESLNFLLDHPRRVFTFLFPSVATWYLVGILVILNGLDLLFFIVLDLNNAYLDEIPTGYRVLCGIFQAFTTRTAGLSVIDISQVRSAVQVSYMCMMYIAVLPLAISVRQTNVYEEQSLGIYRKGDKPLNDYDDTKPKSFLSTHLKKQLGFDLWFLAICAFIICIADMTKLENDPLNFNVFKIFFEIFSAYGTVGLSLGFNGSNASFSGQFSVISKLIICLVMIRGRHRGLPYTLDRAIMLPSDKMDLHDQIQEEEELEEIRTRETNNRVDRNNSLFKAISQKGNEFLNI